LPLAQGIDVAQNEFVLMTDGDCVVPASWAKTMVSYFADGVGIVCGVTLPRLEAEPGFPLTWFECIDWSYLLGVCAGFASVGQPLALIGNNYAVRRSTYLELGTFRKMEFNSIDDIALQRAVMKSGRWSIAFPVDAEMVVRTLPMGGVSKQAKQRRRWAKGKDIMDPLGQAILGFAVMTHLTWPFWISLWGLWGLLGAAMIGVGDMLVIASTLLKTRAGKPIRLIFLYPFYTFLYGWMLVFYLITTKTVQWKARPFAG
jgi:cellulose synthase/poly-beta-1,6-N-acetylglucosamine synthase-like glycosyltransferase